MPMIKTYQEQPVSAQLFWSDQRETDHAAEQLNRQQRLEGRQAEEAGDGGDQNGENGSEQTESVGSTLLGDDSSE